MSTLGNVLDLERYFRTELHNNRFLVCYFGDSLKSDIISCDKTCGWKTVYLAEELLIDGDSTQLEDGDSDLLNTKGLDLNISRNNQTKASWNFFHIKFKNFGDRICFQIHYNGN